MTGVSLIDGLYDLLNDNASRRNDDVPFYDQTQLIRILTGAREGVFEALLERSMNGNRSRMPLMQRFGRITISRMMKFSASIDGTPVPPDFWKVISGFDSNGQYVPPRPIYMAESMAYAGKPQVWVRGGVWKGTAANAYYWAKPSEVIAYSTVAFTEFSDAFYNCVMSLAALEAILQENLDIKSRYAELENIFTQQLESLR